MRGHLFCAFAFCLVFTLGPACSDTEPGLETERLGERRLCTFTADPKIGLKDPEPLELDPDTLLSDAVEVLGHRLAEGYFSTTYTGTEADIHFEVIRINTFGAGGRRFRIGVVNMQDPERACMHSFFQGSSGATTTYCMLTATLMQPQLDPPLLDGLVLLYNGEPIRELDHINLAGILTPRQVEPVVRRAMQSDFR